MASEGLRSLAGLAGRAGRLAGQSGLILAAPRRFCASPGLAVSPIRRGMCQLHPFTLRDDKLRAVHAKSGPRSRMTALQKGNCLRRWHQLGHAWSSTVASFRLEPPRSPFESTAPPASGGASLPLDALRMGKRQRTSHLRPSGLPLDTSGWKICVGACKSL